MKKVNGYWFDENNNRGCCVMYTEEQATRLSKTMIGCNDCIDCKFCISCDGLNNGRTKIIQ